MGNKRIYLWRDSSKYAKMVGGAIITITSLFFVLMIMGFEITGSDDYCLGTPEDPCISYGKICNLGPDNYDIYNPEGFKMDFSPTIKNYWIFFKDGRVKKEFLYNLGIDHSTKGWRYENFTNATKPRKDRVYVHRFARYSCQDYMLVGLKENSDDIIKWGVGVGKKYLDPFWYGINTTADTLATEIILELGSQINISANMSLRSYINATDGFDVLSAGTETAIGIAFDSTDNSFWIVDNPDDFVYHFNSSGDNQTDGFDILSAGAGDSHGIAFDSTDNSFWITDRTDRFVYHFNSSGDNQTDGFSVSDLLYAFGIAFDSTDNSSWIVETLSGFVYHFNSSGDNQTDGFDASTVGTNNMRGITFDSTDNSFWVTGPSDDFVYHFNSSGDNQTDGFSVSDAGSGNPIGITFDPTDNSFWVTDSIDDFVYHFIVESVCVDIDHPDYGINYTCGSPNAEFLFNISYFRKIELNDSSATKNLSFNGPQNQTVYIAGHQYDEILNLSINITGYKVNGTFPTDLKIYINDSLSNSIAILASQDTLTKMSDDLTEKNLTFSFPGTEIVYFEIPKVSTVSSAYLNLTGFQGWDKTNRSSPGGSGDGWCVNGFGGEPVNDCANAFDNDSSTYAGMDKFNQEINQNFSFTLNNQSNFSIGIKVSFNPDIDNTWIVLRCLGNDDSLKSIRNLVSQRYCDTTTVDEINENVCEEGSNCVECIGINAESLTVNVPEICWNETIKIQHFGSGSSPGEIYRMYENEVFYNQKDFPENITLEIGTVDGIHEWNQTGKFSTINRTDNINSSFSSYLSSCTADDDGNCQVPAYVTVESSGIVKIFDIDINYSFNPNPVILNKNLLESFLGNSTNFIDIPIKFSSSKNGTVEIKDIRYDYAGGNDTIEVLVYRQGNKDINETLNLTIYSSNWNYKFPTYISWLEFIPGRPTSVNVTPFGQTPSRPILNMTNYGYGGMESNFSSYLNETHSCVNLTMSTTNDKSSGFSLNATWRDYFVDFSYLGSQGLWMWADYSCNYTTWKLWEPDLHFRNCCEDCICSEDLL